MQVAHILLQQKYQAKVKKGESHSTFPCKLFKLRHKYILMYADIHHLLTFCEYTLTTQTLPKALG